MNNWGQLFHTPAPVILMRIKLAKLKTGLQQTKYRHYFESALRMNAGRLVVIQSLIETGVVRIVDSPHVELPDLRGQQFVLKLLVENIASGFASESIGLRGANRLDNDFCN